MFSFFLEPRTCETGGVPDRSSSGKAEKNARRWTRGSSRVPGLASRGPTCEGAGPYGAGPISTYLRSPGLLPLVPESCGAQRGAESLLER